MVGPSDGDQFVWQVAADNGADCGGVDCETRSTEWFVYNTNPYSWFQTQIGDVHAEGDIASDLPVSTYFSNRLIYASGRGSDPGVISYNGATTDFGSGEISVTDWLTNDDFTNPYDFDYFYQRK